MSQALIEQLKKARQVRIESGDVVFIITRPTDLDVAISSRMDLSERAIFSKYVIGWDKVTEHHITHNGDSTPVAFDADLFQLWVEDHPEHWLPITSGIRDAYSAHQQRLEDSAKN